MTDVRKAASNAEVESAAEVGRRWPKPGDRMRFLGQNGYDGERADAQEVFGGVVHDLVVKKFNLGDWRSTIEFEGIAGHWNSVMFDFVSRAPQAPQGDGVVEALANTLITAAPSHQGGSSEVGRQIAAIFGIDFPIRCTLVGKDGEWLFHAAGESRSRAQLLAALAPKEGATTADLGRAVEAWAEIAEHYRCAMLAAETAINSTPMPVSDGQTSLIWKRFSEAATGLHTARMDMIHKYGPAFLNSGPIGPAALPAQAAEPVAVKALQEAIQFLGWVATSYDTHGDTAEKSGGHPEEVEAYRGSAGMARDHAKALAALSGAAPQAGEDAKPEQWGDETVIADWWLIQNKHGQIVRGERTKDAAVNLDGGLWEGDIIIPVKRAVAAPPAEGWRPIETAPVNRVRVMLWDGGAMAVGHWSRSLNEWFADFPEKYTPTHWRPLPTPPDSQGGEDAAD